MKWNISFLLACVLLGGASSFILKNDGEVIDRGLASAQVIERTPQSINEESFEEPEDSFEITDIDEVTPLNKTEISEKISKLMKLHKERDEKSDKKLQAKKKSLKEVIAEYKKMKELQKFYEDIEELPSESKSDPILVAFGNQSQVVTISPSEEVESSSGGAVDPNDEVVTEDYSIEIKTWKSKNNFLVGVDSVDLYASIRSNGAELPEKIDGEVYNYNHQKDGEISYYKQDGALYHAIYAPVRKTRESSGKYYVKLAFQASNKKYHFMESFSINTRKVIFFNRVEYEITQEKNLQFRTFCNVIESGIYLFQGALYDSNDEFVAIAETPLRLRSGITWVEMDFHGSILRSKKINGPYTLKNFAIYQVNQDLSSSPQEMVEINYTTADHTWDEFNSSSVINPLNHGKAEFIKEAISLE